MKITADTPISSLMDSNRVSSLCSEFSSIVDNFKEVTGGSINKELEAGLSGENCLIDGEPLLEDAGTETFASINNIDSSIVSKVISTAKEKRFEELTELGVKIILKLHSLQVIKTRLEGKEELLPEEVQQLTDVIKQMDKYEKKLDDVRVEIGMI